MNDVNRLTLIGNITADPDVRATTGGTMVAKTGLATTRNWAPEGEDPQTDFHRLVIWGKSAEFADKYVKRGDRMYVEGEVQYGSYEKDGRTVYTSEVKVIRITHTCPKKQPS